MSYEKERIKLKQYKELPYTIVGHTPLMPSFNIGFKAGGLKKLVENCHDEDMIHITIHNKKSAEFAISKYKES